MYIHISDPFAQHSPLPLNQNQMGFNQMGFNPQVRNVFQKPETATSTSGFQKPGDSTNQFQNSEAALAAESISDKSAANKKKDKPIVAQKSIAQKTDTLATPQVTTQGPAQVNLQPGGLLASAAAAAAAKKDNPVNPIMPAKTPMMIPFAKVRGVLVLFKFCEGWALTLSFLLFSQVSLRFFYDFFFYHLAQLVSMEM